jgi:hypothetical protein
VTFERLPSQLTEKVFFGICPTGKKSLNFLGGDRKLNCKEMQEALLKPRKSQISLSLYLSLSLFLFLFLFISLSLSLSLTHSLSLFLTLSISHSLILSFSYPHSHSFSLSLTLTLILFLLPSLYFFSTSLSIFQRAFRVLFSTDLPVFRLLSLLRRIFALDW